MSWSDTAITRRLGLRLPILLAPMSGGPSTAALVAAVSDAGGLGSLGAGYLAPEALRSEIEAVRARTQAPFAVNLFVPGPVWPETPAEVASAQLGHAREALQPLRALFGLPDAEPPARFAEAFDAQISVVLEERVPLFSFTFGIPAPRWLTQLRHAGIVTAGTATTVAEGSALADAGIDLVFAQGAEAGGHRGSFLRPELASLVATMALVPQLVDALSPRGVPIIASGGIMDGRGIAAALALGADAAALGTAFLRTPESGASPAYKAAIAEASDGCTVLTRAFSGRYARGVENEFVRRLGPVQELLPPYPAQNALTREIRTAAARAGNADYLSLWAGQGVHLARELPAAQLMSLLVRETDQAIARLSSLRSDPPPLAGPGRATTRQ